MPERGIAARKRRRATGWFLWMRIRIPARSCSRKSLSRSSRGAVWRAAARSGWVDIIRLPKASRGSGTGSAGAGRLLAGSFIFCDAAAFRKVGGFSQGLFAGEELDLSRRLRLLGRETGLEIVILHRHPLVTSARKIHLYSGWEHFRFLFRAAFNYRQTITDRKACHQWYDGRR